MGEISTRINDTILFEDQGKLYSLKRGLNIGTPEGESSRVIGLGIYQKGRFLAKKIDTVPITQRDERFQEYNQMLLEVGL